MDESTAEVLNGGAQAELDGNSPYQGYANIRESVEIAELQRQNTCREAGPAQSTRHARRASTDEFAARLDCYSPRADRTSREADCDQGTGGFMHIGIILGRIGDVDGVALETTKWITVLERLGHTVFILAGNFKEHAVEPTRETTYRPLSFFSPECEWEQGHAFFFPPDDPDELITVVHKNARAIATEIFRWVLVNKIDVLLSENASSLPCHLSMGLGIKRVAERISLPVVTHDHDFAWERGTRYLSPFQEVNELVESAFPLRLPHVHHAVINTAARTELKQRYDIDSTVVPNVMDFNQDYAHLDSYNRDFLGDIGMKQGDIPLFQVTRIVKRKGIETAIELVDRIDDPRVKLVITGNATDDNGNGYLTELMDDIQGRAIGHRVAFAYDRILASRNHNRHKIYSLADAYANASGITYFSSYEGFGNAFVEAVLAKRPVFVNNYKPVYWPDIGSKGFQAVMIEDGVLTEEAVSEIDRIIHDPGIAKQIVEHNYEVGRRHFSYEVLEELLVELFQF